MVMLRNKPRLSYCGLTIIMSNVSRFDRVSLLTATGGQLLNNHCLQPDYNIMQCDVRLMEDHSPFLDGTRCILLLGEAAMHEWCPFDTRNNTLNEMRGSPLTVAGIPAIASFFPQDAADYKAYEQTLNPQSKEYTTDETFSEDDDEGDVKRFSQTKRSNYAFWLKADVGKCKSILKDGIQSHSSRPEPTYKIYPSADEVINELTKHKNEYLYFDMETDYEEQNLLCFSFTFDNRTIYCVPVLDFDYKWAYSSLCYIIKALAISIRDNIVVAHNGAAFDFFVLGSKYHIPVNKCYDTMLATHRCYPSVEKSLGHCTSLWTWERFHKDTDSHSYFTREHMMKKLQYCGKDVFTMFLVKQAIDKYSSKIPGLEASIDCANKSIRPYLTCMIQGISYSQDKVSKLQNENDRLMMQYLRMIDILIGEQGREDCKKAVKGKAKGFANSNAQCCEYFHELLGYPVVARSLKTGKPSLAKKALYKLALKHPDNPVITIICLFRKVAKEYGSLKFIPFKDNDNRIIDYEKFINSEQQQFGFS